MTASRLPIGLLGAAFLLLAGPAYGQRGFAPGKPLTESAAGAPARQEPPPALPGSRAEPAAVAPASRPALDMPPTEALFDAINRGDLAAAKDALNRGAELNGHNVLGLTPLDLAIDLGRNDITFVLLSMRGTEAPRPAPDVAETSSRPGQRPAVQRPTALGQSSPRQAILAQPPAEFRPARYSSAPSQQPAAAQAPRRFAGDGGAPNPRAGFLGFDSSR